MSVTWTVRLGDGRRLAATEWGAPDGSVVVLQHGTPASRRQLVFDESAARERGLRMLSVDRPGYGQSTFDPRRSFRSWARDVGELADALDVERLAVLGHSGGGPNALACAAVLGERVAAVVLVASPAPPAHPTRRGVVRPLRQRVEGGLRIAVARRAPRWALGMARRSLPPADVAITSKEPYRSILEAELRDASRTTARAAALDRRLGRADWGFDLGQVRQCVHLFHGTDDRSVPVATARRLAELIANPVVHVLEGAGHLFVFERFFEVIDQAGLSQRDTTTQPSA